MAYHLVERRLVVGAMDKGLMTFLMSRPSESSLVRASKIVSVSIGSLGEIGGALARGSDVSADSS